MQPGYAAQEKPKIEAGSLETVGLASSADIVMSSLGLRMVDIRFITRADLMNGFDLLLPVIIAHNRSYKILSISRVASGEQAT
jgi:hypothetical protein